MIKCLSCNWMDLESGLGRICYNRFMVVVLFVRHQASETKPLGEFIANILWEMSACLISEWAKPDTQDHKQRI